MKFFQADHRYVTVRHEGGEVLIDDTLRDLENEFGDRVVRIHRNALVMMDHLEGLERNPAGHYQIKDARCRRTIGRQPEACIRSM